MIQVNGTPVAIAAGKTLQEYLDTTDYVPTRIAVERNGGDRPQAAVWGDRAARQRRDRSRQLRGRWLRWPACKRIPSPPVK